MKYLAWSLIIVGLMAIFFGFESCHHERAVYLASHPSFPPEADLDASTMDEISIFSTCGGIIVLCLGLYLRSRTGSGSAAWRMAERMTFSRSRFCPKCGRPLKTSECIKEERPGFSPRLKCGDCDVRVSYSGMIIISIGVCIVFAAIGTLCVISTFGFVGAASLLLLPVGLGLCGAGALQSDRQMRKAKEYFSRCSQPPK